MALAFLMRRKLRTLIGVPVRHDAGIGQKAVAHPHKADHPALDLGHEQMVGVIPGLLME